MSAKSDIIEELSVIAAKLEDLIVKQGLDIDDSYAGTAYSLIINAASLVAVSELMD